MQYRVSGTIGEFVVDLVVDVPKRERSGSKKSVSGVTDEVLASQVEEIKSVLGERLSRQAELMTDLLARRNKNGTVAFSRVFREVWSPLEHALAGRYSREALEYGMGVALEKGKPVAYAKAVAREWNGEPVVSSPEQPERKYRIV